MGLIVIFCCLFLNVDKDSCYLVLIIVIIVYILKDVYKHNKKNCSLKGLMTHNCQV